jgi:hypothetical protein
MNNVTGLVVLIAACLALASALMMAGCTASDAKPPQHALEIGDPVLVRYPFPSLAECEQFTNRLIVVLHKSHTAIPEPMRCQ